VINFPDSAIHELIASEVCSSLLRALDNAGTVLIAPPRTGSSDTTEAPVPQSYFTVRRPHVIRALQWLQRHNALYRDIEIEEVSDDAPLSSQSPVNEVELDAEGESSVIRRDLQLPNVEVSNLINSNAPVHQLQRVQGALISTHVLMLNRWPFRGFIRMALMGIKLYETHPSVHWTIFSHAT